MKTFVFDTSAMIRLYIPDGPLPDGTENAIELAWRAEAVALVPELALVEAGQVLHKKTRAGRLTKEEANEILLAILDLPMEVAGHRAIVGDALDLARRHDLTVYDAIFVALALDKRAELISADDKLLRAWSRAVRS